MKKLAVTMAGVLLVALMVSSALAYREGRERGGARGPCGGRDAGAYLQELNLTPEQSDRIAALREAHLKEVKPLQDKMFSKRGDLKLLWLQKNPDEGKIKATQKEIRVLRDQIEDKQSDFRLAAMKVLTPEQQAKIKSRFGHGWGPCFEGGAMGPFGGPDDGSGGRPHHGMMGY